MRIILVIILSIVSLVSKSQVSYSGFIDKYPILLVTYIYSDGEVKAIYAYDKYDSPILINGTCKGHKLKLHERNDKNEITATLNFENFDRFNSTSKSNKNKMILVEKTCLEYDDEKKEFHKSECE